MNNAPMSNRPKANNLSWKVKQFLSIRHDACCFVVKTDNEKFYLVAVYRLQNAI